MSTAPLRARLVRALEGQAPRRFSLEIPPGALDWRAAWERAPDLDATLWMPPEGRRLWGLGVAARVDPAEGPAGLEAALAAFPPAGEEAANPPFFAALPFDPGAPMSGPWAPFGGGVLILPRLLVAEEDGRARLWGMFGGPGGSAAEILALWDRIVSPAGASAEPGAAALRPLGRDREGWARAIRATLAEIEAGRLRKLVLAREAAYTLSPPLPSPDPAPAALARLLQTQPRSVVFGLRWQGSTFLGATPERLLSLRGRRLRTDALAGTGAEPDALRASEKDRLEHQIVVDEIARLLGPRCARLDWRAPEVLELPGLCHLRTRFEGELSDGESALSLVRLLHPTPAVGGDPREAALAAIRAEPAPRGLYAGPVGWVEAGGDGELWVGLRSGLLRGEELRLYAGVGVVRGSDPDAEWVETERKLRVMEAAFGA